jgi:hypothetical protein
VTVNGRTSKPVSVKADSLVDRPFLRPFLVRKTGGKGKGIEKVALVTRDDPKAPGTNTMLVAPTASGEPAVWVGRKNADKFYTFVRYLRPDESVSFPGIADGPARNRG